MSSEPTEPMREIELPRNMFLIALKRSKEQGIRVSEFLSELIMNNEEDAEDVLAKIKSGEWKLDAT